MKTRTTDKKNYKIRYAKFSSQTIFIWAMMFLTTTVFSQIANGTAVPDGELEAVGRLGGCTATLIGPKTVLTAAHCVCRGETTPTDCRPQTTFTLVNVRPVDDPSTINDESITRVNISFTGTVRVHPKYTLAKINGVFVTNHWLSNDYAIVDLDQAVSSKALNVRPMTVEIPAKRPKLGDQITLIGFGRTGNDCNFPGIGKRKITLPLHKISTGNVTLRIGRVGMGACPGDSGGPALNTSGNIVGVSSTSPGNYDPTDLAYNFIHGFKNLGGDLSSAPAVVETVSGRLEVFMRGKNHKLVQKSWNGTSWSGWKNLGGHLASAPTVVHTGAGKLEVFMRGKHGDDLVQRSWNGTSWSGWKNLGGDLASAPTVVHMGSGKLEVFMRGRHNNDLVQKSWNGSNWSGWKNLGGDLSAAPAAVTTGSGRLEVFVRGKNHKLVQRSWNGSSWSGWKNLGGQLAAAPSVVHTGSRRLEVFMVGQHNDELVQRSWNGSNWSGWKNLRGNIASSTGIVYIRNSNSTNSLIRHTSAISHGAALGRIEVFVCDKNNDLLHRSFPYSSQPLLHR